MYPEHFSCMKVQTYILVCNDHMLFTAHVLGSCLQQHKTVLTHLTRNRNVLVGDQIAYRINRKNGQLTLLEKPMKLEQNKVTPWEESGKDFFTSTGFLGTSATGEML